MENQLLIAKNLEWGFSKNINIWKNYLIPLKEIRYLEIGSFEGRSAVFVGELNNVKELTCVDTFKGSDEQKNINFDLVYKNCSDNLKKIKFSISLKFRVLLFVFTATVIILPVNTSLIFSSIIF